MASKRTIQITLKRFGKPAAGGGPQLLDLPEGTRLADLLAQQAAPAEALIVVVNGVPEHGHDRPLKNGDVVALFPPMSGG